MRKLALILWALLCLPTIVLAQSNFKPCYTTGQSNCVQAVAASNAAIMAISSNTTAQLVALVAGKRIYVTSWDLISSAAGTFKFVYGTGTNCGTGTTDLTGTYTFGTSTVFTKGNGMGMLLVVPVSNALCYTSASSIAAQGTVSYVQF